MESQDNRPAIRVKLPVLRAQRNRMTQTELAQLAGISQKTISRLETGETNGIDFDTLANLCRALDCQTGEVLEFVPGTVEQQTPTPARESARRGRGRAGK